MVRRTLPVTGEVERVPRPGIVADLIWAHATPDDKLQHVRANTSIEQVDIVLFIDAGDGDEAAALADRLCARATAAGTISGVPPDP
jgi:hypothetical protein